MGGRMKYGPRFAQSGAGGKVGYDPLLHTTMPLGARHLKAGSLAAMFHAAKVSARGRELGRDCAVAKTEFEATENVLVDATRRALGTLKLGMAIFNGSVAPNRQINPLVDRRALLEVIEKLAAIVHRAELMMGGQ